MFFSEDSSNSGSLPELALRPNRDGSHALIAAGWRPVPTPHVEIRYRVREGAEDEQEQAVLSWMNAVTRLDEDSIESSVLRTEDGRTFVHRLWFGSEMAGRRWLSLPEERRFRKETQTRCEEEPEILYLTVLASTVLSSATGLGTNEAAGATL